MVFLCYKGGDGNRYKEIVSLNGLKSNVIYSGMKLKIPNRYEAHRGFFFGGLYFFTRFFRNAILMFMG